MIVIFENHQVFYTGKIDDLEVKHFDDQSSQKTTGMLCYSSLKVHFGNKVNRPVYFRIFLAG